MVNNGSSPRTTVTTIGQLQFKPGSKVQTVNMDISISKNKKVKDRHRRQ